MNDKEALDLIAGLMSGKQWDADTLEKIANLVRCTDRVIMDYEEPEYFECGYCGKQAAIVDQHWHHGRPIGPCCWDERLKITE